MSVHQAPKSCFQKYSSDVKNFLSTQEASTSLYKHQIEAVNKILAYFDSNNNGYTIVELPTGCGKTGVAVISAYVLEAKRVLVVTPSVNIMQQMKDAFCSHTKSFFRQQKIIEAKDVHILPSPSNIKNQQDIIKYPDSSNDLIVMNIQKIQNFQFKQDAFDLVIVDEAHHYPARTWTKVIDNFPQAKRLFLTATPIYKGKPITHFTTADICYTLSKQNAIHNVGIIRDVKFDEAKNDQTRQHDDDQIVFYKIAYKIIEHLDAHDKRDSKYFHQAMVLTQTTETLNSAETFAEVYNVVAREAKQQECGIYTSKKGKNSIKLFNRQELRTLVVVGKLLEGYDNKHVSVVAIVRNVHIQSRVLFTQFVGRAVRKLHKTDPVNAMVISHERYKQQDNFDLFFDPKIVDEEIVNEDEDQQGWCQRAVDQQGGGQRAVDQQGGGQRAENQQGGGQRAEDQQGGGQRAVDQQGGGQRAVDQQGGGQRAVDQQGGGQRAENQQGGGQRAEDQQGGGQRAVDQQGGGQRAENQQGGCQQAEDQQRGDQ